MLANGHGRTGCRAARGAQATGLFTGFGLLLEARAAGLHFRGSGLRRQTLPAGCRRPFRLERPVPCVRSAYYCTFLRRKTQVLFAQGRSFRVAPAKNQSAGSFAGAALPMAPSCPEGARPARKAACVLSRKRYACKIQSRLLPNRPVPGRLFRGRCFPAARPSFARLLPAHVYYSGRKPQIDVSQQPPTLFLRRAKEGGRGREEKET